MVGKLDIPYHGKLLPANLLCQESHRGRRRLRLRAAAWKGGVILYTVGCREVPQRETVAKHHGAPVLREKLGKLPIQSLQLVRVVFGSGAVGISMSFIQNGQPLPDRPGNDRGIGRVCPNMLVQAYHLALSVAVFSLIMVVFVIMADFGLHSLYQFFLQQRHAVDHAELLSAGLHGVQNGLHPFIGLAAQIDEQIAVLHRQNIRRGRLIGVTFRAGRQQQLHVRQSASGGPGKIIGRKHSGHDVQSPWFPLRDRLTTGSQQQAEGEQQGQ